MLSFSKSKVTILSLMAIFSLLGWPAIAQDKRKISPRGLANEAPSSTSGNGEINAEQTISQEPRSDRVSSSSVVFGGQSYSSEYIFRVLEGKGAIMLGQQRLSKTNRIRITSVNPPAEGSNKTTDEEDTMARLYWGVGSNLNFLLEIPLSGSTRVTGGNKVTGTQELELGLLGQEKDLFYGISLSPKQSATFDNRYRGSDRIILSLGKNFSELSDRNYGPELVLLLLGSGRRDDSDGSYIDFGSRRLLQLKFFYEARQEKLFFGGFAGYAYTSELDMTDNVGDKLGEGSFSMLSGAIYVRLELSPQLHFVSSYETTLSSMNQDLTMVIGNSVLKGEIVTSTISSFNLGLRYLF